MGIPVVWNSGFYSYTPMKNYPDPDSCNYTQINPEKLVVNLQWYLLHDNNNFWTITISNSVTTLPTDWSVHHLFSSSVIDYFVTIMSEVIEGFFFWGKMRVVIGLVRNSVNYFLPNMNRNDVFIWCKAFIMISCENFKFYLIRLYLAMKMDNDFLI